MILCHACFGISSQKYRDASDFGTAYSDVALGHDLSQGKGRSGAIVKIGGGPVCWGRHVQQTVANSSQAAELLAIHEATQMTLKINNLLEELGCRSQVLPMILEDNNGTIATAMDKVGGKKWCRHLALKYHLIRESCEEKKIRVEQVGTRDQAADALTKGNHHSKAEWNRLVGLVGMVDTTKRIALREEA